MKHFSLFFLVLLALLLRPGHTQAQTVLAPGDLLLVGYNAQDPDDFAFVPLVDLKPGTEVKFTDNGWLDSDQFRAGEGICLYTAPAGGVLAGTVVGYRANATAFTQPGAFGFLPDGDQLLAYQGPETDPAFVCGLAYGKQWSGTVSPQDSKLPPGLVAGSSVLFLPWANGAYASNSPRAGTVEELRKFLTDPTRWAGDDGTRANWRTDRLNLGGTGEVFLNPGDVLLLGYNAEDPDDFAFVPLVDLEAGTQLKFTDNGWLDTEQFRAGEGTAVYTTPKEGVPAGTVISYRANAEFFTHPGKLSFLPEGDQLLVYQGSEDGPAFVCALAYDKAWSANNSPKDSKLPPGLVAGSSALYLPWPNGAYADTSPRAGNADDLRAWLTDPANWSSRATGSDWRIDRLDIRQPVYLPAPPAPADSLTQQRYQLFSRLDVSQVPTGFLAEAGLHLLRLPRFNGALTDSSRTTPNVMRLLRVELASCSLYGRDTLPSLPVFNARLRAAAKALAVFDTVSGRRQGPIPVVMYLATYASIRPDAGTNNLLRFQNGRLLDVAGRRQSPYQVNTLFAAAPNQVAAPTNEVSFIFRRALYLSSTGSVPTGLALDFGDGNGYRAAAWDQTIGTNYATPGTKRLKVRCTYASSTSYESWFDFEVQSMGVVSRYDSRRSFHSYFKPPGATYGATVTVYYGQGHGPVNGQQRLIKPFIIAEQYNLASVAPHLVECNNANNTVEELLGKIGSPDTDPFDFNNHLEAAGYDLVYIDFERNTDDIRQNAKVFEYVVQRVNAYKLASQQAGLMVYPNVVMGMSMGGLISRYGLAEMTKNPTGPFGPPDTRLLVLHDSPQRGAYNPVGLQSFTRSTDTPMHLTVSINPLSYYVSPRIKLRDLNDRIDDALNVLDEPATQQLAILNAFNGQGDIRSNTFIDGDYSDMVDFTRPINRNLPQPTYDIVATSDGSQCGTGSGAPVGVVLSDANTHSNTFTGLVSNFDPSSLGVRGAAYGLPAYGQQATISHMWVYLEYRIQLFYNVFIPYRYSLLDETALSPANTIPYETLPGGTTNLDEESGGCGAQTGLTSDFLRTSLYNGKICFVPTYSALDVPAVTPGTSAALYVNNATNNPVLPRVARYVAQANPQNVAGQYNLKHLAFTPRNSEWIFNEMQRPFFVPSNGNTNPNPLNCGQTECTVPLVITGPQSICGPATYSALAIPGATYHWTTTPAGVFSPATGTGSTFVTSVGPSTAPNARVTVAVTSPCNNFTQSLPVAACSQMAVTLSFSGYTSQGGCYTSSTNQPDYGNFVAHVSGAYGSVTFKWYTNWNDPDHSYNAPQPSSYPEPPLQIGGNTFGKCLNDRGRTWVKVVATDYTGTTRETELSVDSQYRSLYPNPADGYSDVANLDANGDPAPATDPIQVTVYNGQGTVMFTSPSTTDASIRLNTQSWPDGLYQVLVQHGGTQTSEQISVQH